MSDLITLEEVKLHCRIDGGNEDTLLKTYIDASLEVCQMHIGRRFDEGATLNPAIKTGCLMYIAQLYAYRETVSDIEVKEVPLAISALWSVYREPGVY